MKNYVLFVICLFVMTNVFAQDDDYYPVKKSRYLGIEGIYNCTLLDLDANNYRDGAGFSFSGFGDLTPSHNPFVLQWGVEGLFVVSSKKRNYYVSTPFRRDVSGLSNAAVGVNGLLRLEYRRLPVHPYIDGFVGGRLFQSGYFTEEFDEYEGRNKDTWSGMSSTATAKWAYGVGAGVMIPVSNRVDINWRMAYTHTGPMQYINMNDFIDNSDGSINPVTSSDYDMLSFHLGVRIRLGDKSKRTRDKRVRKERRTRHRDCSDGCNRPIIGILNDVFNSPRCTRPPNDCSDEPSRPRTRSNTPRVRKGDRPPVRDNEPDNNNGCEPNYGTPSSPNGDGPKPRRTKQETTDDNNIFN